MTMFITARQKKYEWHVGELNPVPLADRIYTYEVQADGDELMHVVAMDNVPIAARRVVVWNEPYSIFIVQNLTNGR